MSYPIKPVTPQINRRLAKLYGIINAWSFSERGGAAAKDSAGAQPLTIGAGATAGVSSPYGPSLGLTAVSVSTTGVYFVAGALPRTTGIWFKVSTPATSQYLYMMGSGITNGRFSLQTLSSKLSLDYASGTISGTTTLLADTWYFASASYDAATVRLYLNGIQEASIALTLDTGTNKQLYIGGNASINPMTGTVAGAFLSNLCLSALSMRALAPDPGALYRQDRRTWALYAPSSAVLFRRSLSARSGSRSLTP